MAVAINLRLDDDREKALKELVESLKADNNNAIEVNNSSVIRMALDSFIEAKKMEEKGYKKLYVNLSDMNDKALDSLLFDFLPYLDEYQKNIINDCMDFKDNEPCDLSKADIKNFVFDLMCKLKLEILDELRNRTNKLL